MKISEGKLKGLEALSNAKGVIAAAAMDQRSSLKKSLAKFKGVEAKDITDQMMEEFKVIVSKVLTPYATAILLDPQIIPKLRKCYILVELHDFIYSEIGQIITERFKQSHKITEIWSRKRTMADFPIKKPAPFFSAILLRKYFVHLMYEYRSERMRWFYLEPQESNPDHVQSTL